LENPTGKFKFIPVVAEVKALPLQGSRSVKVDRQKKKTKTEIENIWKALTNLDKADVQTTALCHAIVSLLIEKGIGSEEEIAREMEKSIPKVMKVRKEIAEAITDPDSIFNVNHEDETIH
jgi:hypothetical protein